MSAGRDLLAESVRLLAQAAERQLDDHPAPEKLAAYARRELPAAEREAIEEHLAWCREDAALVRDFALLGGEADLDEAELEAAWGRFEGRRAAAPAGRERHLTERHAGGSPAPLAVRLPRRRKALTSPRAAYAAAAALLVAAGLALAWGVRQDRRLRQELLPSAEVALIDLVPLGSERGPAQAGVAPVIERGYRGVLILSPEGLLPGGEYEARIRDARGQLIWSGATRPSDLGVFVLDPGSGFLAPGAYHIELVAKSAAGEAVIGRYSVEVGE